MTVVNKRTHVKTDNDVYIGRGSIWGNPYIIGKTYEGHVGTRENVIALYRIYIKGEISRSMEMKDKLMELDGKNLVCYCSPKACHGDVLEELIEEALK